MEHALAGVDKSQIAAEAARLGFDAIGVADARAPWQAAAWLEEFLREGRHGDMGWMAQDRRSHPNALWPDAKSAIVVGQSYAPHDDAIALLEQKRDGIVSAYAARRDFTTSSRVSSNNSRNGSRARARRTSKCLSTPRR